MCFAKVSLLAPSHSIRSAAGLYLACNIQSIQIKNCNVIISRDRYKCALSARLDQDAFRSLAEREALHLLA